jgi:hypothetical protein
MPSVTLPKLTANGLEIATAPDKFGLLRSSADILDDAAALRRRLQEDGYLFLPGLLDRDEVMAARGELTNRLAAEGLLDPAYPPYEAVAKPGTDGAFRPDLARNNPAIERVLYAGPMMEFYQRFFGEEVRHFDYTWLRATAPGRNASPHCDIVYMGRGTFDVLTAWTPLGDIAIDGGTLTILEGSYRKREELADYLSRDVDTYCANGPNAEKIESGEMSWESDGSLSYDAPALRDELGGRWLTAPFQMGDMLTFTMATVHASLDNGSDRIRLSTDSRYQRALEPADERWIGANPVGHGLAGKRGRIC